MFWRRRASSLSSVETTTTRVPDIEHLNSRFRLRIPKNLTGKIIMKETFLHSDDSTCSTQSSRSSDQSSTTNATTHGKRVHFSDQVVVFLPTRSFPTDEEASTIWLHKTEIINMKNELRSIWKGSHINDQDFVAAVDMVQSLFASQAVPTEIANEDNPSLDASQIEITEMYKECARILARHDGRGLERMHYGTGTFSKVGAKSLHVQKFIRSVLQVQAQMKDSAAIDLRATAIAAQCHYLPPMWFARILAQVDEESSSLRDDKMSMPTNVIQRRHRTESVEV